MAQGLPGVGAREVGEAILTMNGLETAPKI